MMSPNSDEFGKVGLGEEFSLRYVLASFNVLGKFWIWAWGSFTIGGASLNGGRGCVYVHTHTYICVCIYTDIYIYMYMCV